MTSCTPCAGLGTAYAAAGEALGLVNAVGSRVNLAFEYTKAGLVRTVTLRKTSFVHHSCILCSGGTQMLLYCRCCSCT